MKTQADIEGDAILRAWAKAEGHSLRASGIIDKRRERTVREREVTFADFFARKRQARRSE